MVATPAIWPDRERPGCCLSGGAIEIHRDAIDGELLATAPVEVNGKWEEFYDRTVDLPAQTGRHDLFFKFVNEKSPGGLMNLDTIHFLP